MGLARVQLDFLIDVLFQDINLKDLPTVPGSLLKQLCFLDLHQIVKYVTHLDQKLLLLQLLAFHWRVLTPFAGQKAQIQKRQRFSSSRSHCVLLVWTGARPRRPNVVLARIVITTILQLILIILYKLKLQRLPQFQASIIARGRCLVLGQINSRRIEFLDARRLLLME